MILYRQCEFRFAELIEIAIAAANAGQGGYMNWMIVAVSAVFIVWFVRGYMAVFVSANTALVLIDCFGNIRAISPGLGFKMPWFFERPVENPKGGVVPLQAILEKFEGIYETKDKTPMKITTAFIRTPVKDYLDQYIKITDDKQRRAGIIERVRAILSILIYEYENRSDVMKNLDKIAKEMEDRFEKAKSEENPANDGGLKLERYFGENVQQFVISDTELSPELAAAQAKKEAQAKENETRKSEMDNMKKMAKELVLESEKRGSTMSYEKALEIIQVQIGKIKKDIKIFGLDRGTQDVVDKIVRGVMANGK